MTTRNALHSCVSLVPLGAAKPDGARRGMLTTKLAGARTRRGLGHLPAILVLAACSNDTTNTHAEDGLLGTGGSTSQGTGGVGAGGAQPVVGGAVGSLGGSPVASGGAIGVPSTGGV